MYFRIALTAVCLALLFIIHQWVISKAMSVDMALQVNFEAAPKDDLRVYYDTGDGFGPKKQEACQIKKNNKANGISFKIDPEIVRGIRIHLGTSVRKYRIKSIVAQVISEDHKPVFDLFTWKEDLLLKSFKPLNHINQFEIEDGQLAVETEGDDPFFSYSSDKSLRKVLFRAYEFDHFRATTLFWQISVPLLLVFYILALWKSKKIVGRFHDLYASKYAERIEHISHLLSQLIIQQRARYKNTAYFNISISVVFCCIVALLAIYYFSSRAPSIFVEVDFAETPTGESALLYYNDGDGFSSNPPVRFLNNKSIYFAKLSHSKTRKILIYLGSSPGCWKIRTISIQMLDQSTNILHKIHEWRGESLAKAFERLHDIEPFELIDGLAVVQTVGEEPYFIYTGGKPLHVFWEGNEIYRDKRRPLDLIVISLIALVIYLIIIIKSDKIVSRLIAMNIYGPYVQALEKSRLKISFIAETASKRLLISVIIIGIVKGCILLLVIPPFQTPDEDAHYDYALYLSKINYFNFIAGNYSKLQRKSGYYVTKEINIILDITGAKKPRRHYDKKNEISLWESIRQASQYQEKDSSEALSKMAPSGPAFSYPPLYYFIVSTFLRLADYFDLNIVIKFLMTRFISLAIWGLSLVYAIRIFKLLKMNRMIQVMLMTILALHPQLSMIGISIQPDNLAILLINLGFFYALRYCAKDDAKDFYIFSGFAGFLMITKIHLFAAFYIPVLFLIILHRIVRFGFKFKIIKIMMNGFIILFFAGGWWYLRNLLIFRNVSSVVGVSISLGIQNSFLANIIYWISEWGRFIFHSYWGNWGWLDYAYPKAVFDFLFVISVIPIVFWAALLYRFALKLYRRLKSEKCLIQNLNLEYYVNYFVMFLPMAAFAVVMLYIASKTPNLVNQGRHWLPFIAPQALYLVGFMQIWIDKSEDYIQKRGLQKTVSRGLGAITVFYLIVFLALDGYMLLLTNRRYY